MSAPVEEVDDDAPLPFEAPTPRLSEVAAFALVPAEEASADIADDAAPAALGSTADSVVPFPLLPSLPLPSVYHTQPTFAIGGPLAYRAMRDALALQLARRGFDGLRQSALWLVTELAGDFLKALGAQLKAEAGGPHMLVRRVQRHANMRRREEWIQAQRSFARVSEPPGTTVVHGGSRATGLEQRQIDPKLAPPAVAPLYAAMKGAWNYKASGAGRNAHSLAGAAPDDWPTASQAGLPPGTSGRELSESLRLGGKKQRLEVETWLQASTGSAHTAPVLLPGKPLGDTPGAGAAADTAPARGRGRKGAK